MDWRHRAICRDEDPELFFPIGNTGPAMLQIEQAKAVCRRCPVIQECLTWALESGQDAGVWGGLSEDERRALKRRNARARARMALIARAPGLCPTRRDLRSAHESAELGDRPSVERCQLADGPFAWAAGQGHHDLGDRPAGAVVAAEADRPPSSAATSVRDDLQPEPVATRSR